MEGMVEIPHVLNVTVSVPGTHTLITEDKYNELTGYSLDPVWNMSNLKKRLKITSDEIIKDGLLSHPRLEKKSRTQGIMHYPDENFNRWRFNMRRIHKFVGEHFNEIYKGGRNR